MPKMLNPTFPRVPNPVNPEEDFADRWAMPEYEYLKLEQNFFLWLRQAQIDFHNITSSNDAKFISESFNKKFSVKVNNDELEKKIRNN